MARLDERGMDRYNYLLSNFAKFAGGRLREKQIGAINLVLNKKERNIILQMPTGCHAKGTEILMATGEIRKVEDVMIGDFIMGDDGTPRKVLSLHKGTDEMYKIIPVKGEPFIVNGGHILSLIGTNEGKKWKCTLKGDEVDNISVYEYIKKSNNYKSLHKLYRGIVNDFYPSYHIDNDLDPYFLGVMIGDGYLAEGAISLCNGDSEIYEYCNEYAEKIGCKVRTLDEGRRKTFFYNTGIKGGDREKIKINPLKVMLESVGLLNHKSADKFIPFKYKTAVREQRLEVLAGIIDTDGSLSGESGYDYISKSEQLAKDVAFICRSVGLAAYIKKCIKSCQNNFSGEYFRVGISGDTNIIPCKVKRKQSKERKQKKRVNVTGFKVEHVGAGEYFGFEVDKNHLYMMGDFTVTHNSGKSITGMLLSVMQNGKAAYMCSTKQLQDQLKKDFPEAGYIKGRNNYRCIEHGDFADECVHSRENPCPSRLPCEYQKAKRELKGKQIQVMNYHFGINIMNHDPMWFDMVKGGDKRYDLVVCDEADVLEQILTEYVSVEVGKDVVRKFGFKPPERVTGKARNAEEYWKQWAKECGDAIERYLECDIYREMQRQGVKEGTKKWKKTEDRYLRLLGKFRFLHENVDKYWIFEDDKKGKYSFKPMWMNERMFEQIMGRFAKRWVFMSGSLPSRETFCRLIGLNIDDSFYAETASSVPVENRKIYCDYQGSMGGKTKEETLPKVVKRIEELMDEHKGQKGLIHSVSFKLSDEICEMLGKGYRERLIIHKQGENKDGVIEEFKKSKSDFVLISPSVSRGCDFPDDYCRFNIMPKCPFLYLGDKLTSSRLYSGKFGEKWYVEQAVQEMLQASGRGVRHDKDWCDTYLLDSDFRRVFRKELVPAWVYEAKEII